MSDADRLRWEARYRAAGPNARAPSEFLLAQADRLPRIGRALDVAGGAGRHALFLARLGLDVTLCDIAETALARARDAAQREGLKIETLALDLETAPLPAGPWNVIVVFDYLQRSLFARWPELLAPGGLLIFSQPTRKNLERHTKPGSRHLLEEGELSGWIRELELCVYDEGWLDEGRHVARVVATKPVVQRE
jgi:tellurite methyltransferase